MIGFSFVDDTDLFQTGSSPIEVLTSMQNLINSFGTLMKVTGAAIAADKSWYYLVDYVWKKGEWRTYGPEDTFDIVAMNLDGEKISLKRLCHIEAAKMLEVWMAPNQDERKLVNVLKTRAMNGGQR